MWSERGEEGRGSGAGEIVRRVAGVMTFGLALATLGACGDDTDTFTGPGNGNGDQTATVDGSIESTNQTASSPYASQTFATTAPSRSSSGAQEASTVAAAAVNGDGSLEVLAEAEVQGDGSFSIEEVPAGRSGLVVSARTSDGDEVGRVLVHGETEGGATVTTEPMNGETTVEGLVHARLTEAGVAEEVRNTARLALMIRMDESTAADVAASAQSIQEVAAGVQAGAEAMAEAYAEMGADASTQNEALVTAALQHAQDRQGGTEVEAAHEAFANAAVDAFAQGGGEADVEGVALATAAAATGLDRAMAVASEEARLDLARNAVDLNLTAREELAAGLESSNEQSAAASALADARVRVQASASVAEIAQVMMETEESVVTELTSLILARIPDSVPVEIRANLESRLESAFADADLSASLEASGAADPAAIAQAVLDYRQQVRAAVDALVADVPSGAGIEAEATTSLLIAARGGPSIGS